MGSERRQHHTSLQRKRDDVAWRARTTAPVGESLRRLQGDRASHCVFTTMTNAMAGRTGAISQGCQAVGFQNEISQRRGIARIAGAAAQMIIERFCDYRLNLIFRHGCSL